MRNCLLKACKALRIWVLGPVLDVDDVDGSMGCQFEDGGQTEFTGKGPKRRRCQLGGSHVKTVFQTGAES